MSLKLRLASWWMQHSTLINELNKVNQKTTQALDNLIKKHSPLEFKKINEVKHQPGSTLEEQRKAMAIAHNLRVNLLIEAIGKNEAMKNGRTELFKIGLQLGKDARKRLDLDDSYSDLVLAAKIMYKILGIEFTVEQDEKGGMQILHIHRCALSDHYTPETCRLLSAADEGVVKGLNPKVKMKFIKRLTDGESECIAELTSEDNEVLKK